MECHFRVKTLLLTLFILPLTGCLLRTPHPAQMRMSTADLKVATLDQLVQAINENSARLQTVKATVDIDLSLKNKKKDSAKEAPQSHGYIRVRKPEMLRMIALTPVVRTTYLDMISDGANFRASYPSRNLFFVGSNQVVKPSPELIWNLRPQPILEALLIKPINPEAEKAVLQQGMEVVKDPKTHKDMKQPDYEVLVIATDSLGDYLSRKIIFSRTDLLPHEQIIYDREGKEATRARYENFADRDGINFPDLIAIERPVEDYSITLAILELKLNGTLPDDQFELAQPPGSKLINVDQGDAGAQSRSSMNGRSGSKPQ
jgi:outer membrane lipoprotein-sorting protein